ncbi:sigma-70 family RNA polymerase sigma factor [Leptospira barantonii]|uniref:Sigma-70 family RNA polymerase sigma factor n=1 Tax=Leptospira barantonii TaxID=2023184 RepID=A0A5F2BE70_9LEPT|nr:sigma-70 family RNA polymerase sigma factor [Leptospira barantonii]TGM03782.1 sigma-70 family RNA polymerase sigma factor [Leptospira barantonii]
MENGELIPHLFRTEYGKIVSVLSKRFGLDRMDIAEDIASETFLTASQVWGIKGVPQNPSAWLYNVAKNKAKNHLQRDFVFSDKIVPELKRAHSEFLENSWEKEIDLTSHNIIDSQLRMMFTICHPSISEEAQIGLALRILCGFGIEEIADAFLTNKETINKRLFRAKEKLKQERIRIELPSSVEIEDRLNVVLRTIYLLFNEGYYSTSQNEILRKDLCFEAFRLCRLLSENETTNLPQVNALLSLICFHSSRFSARQNERGESILYQDQDPNLWDRDLIVQGGYFLSLSAKGNRISKYHLEAEIAYWHTQKEDSPSKWENIVQAYDRLLKIEYSSFAALNRIYALSKVNGKEKAILEAEKFALNENRFYHALLGELYSNFDDVKAKASFEKALSLAKTQSDRSALQKRIDRLGNIG